MIAEPPFEGSDHDITTFVEPPSTTVVGAAGVAGTDAASTLNALVNVDRPTAFLAAILNW